MSYDFFTLNHNKLLFNKSSSIPLAFLKQELTLYKNQNLVPLTVTRRQVGYKFGEFVFSRKPFFFVSKVKKQKLLKR